MESGELVDPKKLKIKIGSFIVAENGRISENYSETKLRDYMKWDSIENWAMMLLNVILVTSLMTI